MVYVPDRGHVVWLDLDPTLGHEQAGRRPALILSPALYNKRSGLALAAPVTSRAKAYPFEVPIPAGLPVTGVILSDHVRSLDWSSRQAAFLCSLPPATVDEALARTRTLLA
jgi:mRNA interferase MazF